MSEEIKESFAKLYSQIAEPFKKNSEKFIKTTLDKLAKDKLVDEEKEQYYTVEVECMVPAKVKFKILAKSPEEAAEKAKVMNCYSEAPKLDLNKIRKIKARVFDVGTVMLKLLKNY